MATKPSDQDSKLIVLPNAGEVEILSSDPAVTYLKGFIYSLGHFRKKGFGTVHLKVLMAVEMLCRVMRGRGFPRIREISSQIKLKPEEFRPELVDLVEARYLHEMFPTYGDIEKNTTYKMGTMGGQMMKRIIPEGDGKLS
jgi:hypothetical protein